MSYSHCLGQVRLQYKTIPHTWSLVGINFNISDYCRTNFYAGKGYQTKINIHISSEFILN